MTTLHTAVHIIRSNPGCFRPGFEQWLYQNVDIARSIFQQANEGWDRGIRKTGINKIIEYLRWDTLLQDATSTRFKISDEWTSSLARLYAMLWPDRKTLFTYHERVSDGVVRTPRIMEVA